MEPVSPRPDHEALPPAHSTRAPCCFCCACQRQRQRHCRGGVYVYVYVYFTGLALFYSRVSFLSLSASLMLSCQQKHGHALSLTGKVNTTRPYNVPQRKNRSYGITSRTNRRRRRTRTHRRNRPHQIGRRIHHRLHRHRHRRRYRLALPLSKRDTRSLTTTGVVRPTHCRDCVLARLDLLQVSQRDESRSDIIQRWHGQPATSHRWSNPSSPP